MTRLATVRVGIAVASLGMALVGCNCPTNPPGCDNSDLTATFVVPTDGAMVDPTSNVQVSLSRKGTPVTIGTAKLEIRGPGATEFGGSRDGQVDGANATFMGVMLAAGENALRATVSEVDCAGTASPVTITVTARSVTTPPPVITACTFPQDTNGDGTLNAMELPAGSAVQVRVQTQNGSGATFSAPGSSPANAPIMNETATISVPGPTADGTFSVTGTVTRGTNAPTCTPSIRVQRTAGCTIENTTSETARGPADDADTNTAGYQVRATASRLAGTVASAQFRLGMQSRAVDLSSMAMASTDFTVSTAGTQTYMAVLEGSDPAGNPCMVTNATRSITVDFEAPVVTITQPATVDGGVLVTRAPVVVTATVGAVDNGATACAFVGSVQADCATVTGGMVSLSVPFGSDGLRTIEVRVTDAAGNVGTARVDVNVVLQGCGIVFTNPSANPALINASQAPGGNYTFRTSSKASCVGQPARLSRASLLPDAGVGTFSQIGMGALTARSFPDGGGDAVGAFPTTVVNGDFVYRAEVDNFGDGGVDLTHVDVTVDLDGPAITSPVVPVGQMRALLNATQDANPSAAGAQRLLSFNARVPMGGRVDVCSSQMGAGPTTPECGAGYFRLATNVTSPTNSFTFPEGAYDLKVVVVGGGTVVESPPVPVTVDVTRPCVLSGSLSLPQDTNMDGRLNATELGTAAPQLQFQLDPACTDTSLATLSATAPVIVREVVSNVVQPAALNVLADVNFNAGNSRVTVNLTQGLVAERDYTFFVELQDILQNRNLFAAGTNPAVLNVRIDRTAPNCSLVAPTATTLNRAAVPGGVLGVIVDTSADVGTNGVTATLSGFMAVSGTPMGTGNQASLSIPGLTGTSTRTLDVQCRDVSGNTTTIPQRSLTIDLDAPTCAFTAPAAGSTSTELTVTTTLNVTGANGRMVTIASTVGGTRGTLTVDGAGVASGPITFQNGLQDLTATLTDVAGNPGSCTVTAINVNSSDCGLVVSSAIANANGLWFNRSNTSNLAGSSGTATVSAQTSTCSTGRTVTLVRTSPMGTPLTAMTDMAGNVSFANVPVADNETWTVSVPNNGITPPTVVTFRVDLDAPTFGVLPGQPNHARINGTLVAPMTPTFFVAASDNRNVETATPGYFADTNGAAADAQINLVLDAVEAFDFGFAGSVAVLFKGTPVVTNQPVTGAGQTISFTSAAALTLPHNDSGALVIRVTDAAGNQTEWTSTATIDVQAPTAPSVTASVPMAQRRVAEVSLTWAPTYDDGSNSASGAHAGYDVRWTTSSVPGSNNLAAASDYFGTAAFAEPNVAWSASTITDRRITVPPFNNYYVVVRARDEVGNYSTYTAPSVLTNIPTELTVTVTGAAAAAFGQTVLGAPSLNNDSATDLVVTAPTKAGGGSVYVYFGGTGFASQSSCGAGCQELLPSDATAGQFGSDVGAGGNVGDIAGENKPDLVVGQIWSPAVGGRVVLYFGTASAATLDTAQAIEFRGDTTNRIGQTARIIPSIDGDALDEIAIAAPLYNGNRGRVYIYKGRTRAQWASARTATDMTTMVPYIPVSETTADYVVNGPTNLLVSPAGNAFGQNRHGLISVGDINSDGRPDIAIPMSRPSINRYRIYSGLAIAGSTGLAPLSGDAQILEFTETTIGDNAVTNGLGSSAFGGLDILDSMALDLVVGYRSNPGFGRVLVFSGPVAMAMGQPTPVADIRGPLGFGFQMTMGRVNSDSRYDMLVGMAQSTANFAFVLYQQAGVRPFAGVAPGVINTTPEFWLSRFDAAAISGNPNSTLGGSNVIVDVDGDTLSDIVLSDAVTGILRIWR